MKFFFNIGCLLVMVLTSSCSKDHDKTASSASDGEAEPTGPNECIGQSECGQGGPAAEPAMLTGLPAFCDMVEYYGKTCARCVPREMPLIKCGSSLVEQFTPQEFCTQTGSVVQCAVPGSDFSITLDHAKITLREKYFVNFPELMSGVKLVIAATLRDDTEGDRRMIFSIIDVVAKHRKAVFSGGDSAAASDEIYAILAEKNHLLDAAGKQTMRGYIDEAIKFFGTGADREVITANDVVGMLRAIFSLLSAKDAGALSTKLNMEKIERDIQSGESLEMITELLKGLEGQ